MWFVIKSQKNKFNFTKSNLKSLLGKDVKFYFPKVLIQKYRKKKLIEKEINLLGDYIFLFHKDLFFEKNLNNLRFVKGLKYFLKGHKNYQSEIKDFIKYCKSGENDKGRISPGFLNIILNKNYKFNSGPFSEKIFKIIGLQRNKIDILLGNLKTTINKKEFSFSPLI